MVHRVGNWLAARGLAARAGGIGWGPRGSAAAVRRGGGIAGGEVGPGGTWRFCRAGVDGRYKVWWCPSVLREAGDEIQELSRIKCHHEVSCCCRCCVVGGGEWAPGTCPGKTTLSYVPLVFVRWLTDEISLARNPFIIYRHHSTGRVDGQGICRRRELRP